MLIKIWQALVSGLSIGSVYALIAQGYYVTYVTTGALNFGQGEFLMVGALFGLTCYVTLGLPYALAVAGAVVLVGAMGAGLERVAIRPTLRHALSLSWVLSTVAVSIILKNAAVQIWGPEQMKFPSPFGDTYSGLGASIDDNVDHNLGYKTFLNGALVSDIVIDTSAPGTSTIDYVATDSARNTATSTRTVIVAAPFPPDPSSDATTTAN